MDNPKDRPSFKDILTFIDNVGAEALAVGWADKRAIGPEQAAKDARMQEELKRISSNAQKRNATAFKLDPKQVTLGKRIGKGSYATVYKGTYQGTSVAIKKFQIGNVPKEVIEDFQKETE